MEAETPAGENCHKCINTQLRALDVAAIGAGWFNFERAVASVKIAN
jgi:hypothetical protein